MITKKFGIPGNTNSRTFSRTLRFQGLFQGPLKFKDFSRTFQGPSKFKDFSRTVRILTNCLSLFFRVGFLKIRNDFSKKKNFSSKSGGANAPPCPPQMTSLALSLK